MEFKTGMATKTTATTTMTTTTAAGPGSASGPGEPRRWTGSGGSAGAGTSVEGAGVRSSAHPAERPVPDSARPNRRHPSSRPPHPSSHSSTRPPKRPAPSTTSITSTTPPPPPLLPRPRLNLHQAIGQTKVINPNPHSSTLTPSSAAGYYCPACRTCCKDSMTWMDHLNGRKHLRNIGSGTKPEAAGREQVRQRLEALKHKMGKGSAPTLPGGEEGEKQKQDHEDKPEPEEELEREVRKDRKRRKKGHEKSAMDEHVDLVRRLMMQAETEGRAATEDDVPES